MNLRDIKEIEERRSHVAKITGANLKSLGIYPEGLNEASLKNCENMIGAISLPLGIAGPLKVCGEYAKGDFYVPLATTEGALVASVSRGAKALSMSGGVRVFVKDAGITRSVMFRTRSLSESFLMEKILKSNFSACVKKAREISGHINLIKAESKVIGNRIYIRFSFDSQGAMGMNLATYASRSIAQYLADLSKIKDYILAANFDIDKKPALLNYILGRGRQVWAEGEIRGSIVRDVLKTDSGKINETTRDKCLIGSAISGSLGFNAHFANVIAAMFIALGQDPAHVSEGCLGITSTNENKGNLYISVHLPDLPLGSIGGGTYLPSQKACLDILGCFNGEKGEKALKLAEIVGASVLAGELSLLASISEGTLAKAHERMTGRVRI